MYNLLGRVKTGQQELCNKMAEYVKKRGKVIVINPEKDKTMVQELLDFKEKLDMILMQCFKNNEKFVTSLKVKTVRKVSIEVINDHSRTHLKVSSTNDRTSQQK